MLFSNNRYRVYDLIIITTWSAMIRYDTIEEINVYEKHVGSRHRATQGTRL